MTDTLTGRFTRYRFTVEVEADPHNDSLVPCDCQKGTARDCQGVLADEITSNLQSLDGIGEVVVDALSADGPATGPV